MHIPPEDKQGSLWEVRRGFNHYNKEKTDIP